MASFTIRQDDDNYLTVTVLSRLIPTAWDTWDGNRVRVRVDYAITGKADSYATVLFASDLEAFRDELAGDIVDDSGLVALTTIDGVVSITMERGANVFIAECGLSTTPDGLLHARLDLEVQMSAVCHIVEDLDSILMQYPVIRPGGAAGPGMLVPPSHN